MWACREIGQASMLSMLICKYGSKQACQVGENAKHVSRQASPAWMRKSTWIHKHVSTGAYMNT